VRTEKEGLAPCVISRAHGPRTVCKDNPRQH
jgi:hypothetical protein